MGSTLRSFAAELRRRKVYRVALVYAAVAFVVWQVAEIAFPALHLPDWALTLIVALTLLGFPVALVLAWAFEITPAGIRRTDGEPGEVGTGTAEVDHAHPEDPAPASVAVLPFVNLSPDPEQEYFCDGMADELINTLTKVKDLRVAARTSSFQFKGRSEDVREIGRKLGVGSVLEGSVRRSGERLRVTAQLVSAEDGYHLWSETYERELADVFAIQDEISRSIVETVRPTLVGKTELARPAPRSMEAYDLFLQGRSYWHQRYEVGLTKALEYFQRATEADPEYALPYTGISDSYVALALYQFVPPPEASEKARSAIDRALALDETSGEAHASRGWFQFMCEQDWNAAEESFRRAIELSPSNPDVRCWYGILCSAQGRFEEACEHIGAARDLDPLSLYTATMEGSVAYLARDFDRAVGMLTSVVERDPGYLFGVFNLEIALSAVDRHQEALDMGERGVTLSNRSVFFQGLLAASYALAGREREARSSLTDLEARGNTEYVTPLVLARGYAALGDAERSLRHLNGAVAEGSPFLFGIHQDMAWDPVRSSPGFQELAGRVGSGVVGSSFPGSAQRGGSGRT